MITIADIADAMHLSTATISNALTGKGRVNENRRREIIAVAQQMGYDFSRIRSGCTQQNIYVIVEQVGITFCDKIVQGICNVAEQEGMRVTVFHLNILTKSNWEPTPSMTLLKREVQKYFDLVDSSCVGLIYVSQYIRDLSGLFPVFPFPVICAYAYARDGIPCVNYDNQHGAFLATSHLISLGRKNIAMITGVVDSIPMIRRFSAYQQALVQARLRFVLNNVVIGSWSVQSGKDAMEQLLKLTPCPDAVFCQNDYIAVGAIRSIHAAGLRVPEDIAVIGFDDVEAAELVDPQLTSIAPPFVEIGEEAVRKLMRILRKEDDGCLSIELPCRIVCRQSA